MENLSQDVVDVNTITIKNSAQISLNVLWKSSLFQDGKPFVHEHTIILVHQLKNENRAIDFEIRLRALVPGVSIGGSNDEKGYGGFCARIKHPKSLIYTSESGLILSGINQIKALIYSAIANGIVAPIIIVCIVHISSNKKIMGHFKNSSLINIVGWITVLLMGVTAVAAIYSLF